MAHRDAAAVRSQRQTTRRTQVVVTLDWDDSWTPNSETPITASSPMSLRQIGIAFWIESTVEDVTDPKLADSLHDRATSSNKFAVSASPARRSIRRKTGQKWQGKDDIISSKRGGEKAFDQWAHWFEASPAIRRIIMKSEVRVRPGQGPPSGTGAAEVDRERGSKTAGRSPTAASNCCNVVQASEGRFDWGSGWSSAKTERSR